MANMKLVLLFAALCGVATFVRSEEEKADPRSVVYTQTIKVVKKPVVITQISNSGPVCPVFIFQHGNYQGKKDTYVGSVSKVKRNDDMSSLKLPANCCVALFEHYNFGGKVLKVCADTKWIGKAWNDKVSSLKTYYKAPPAPPPPPCSVTVFQHSNYKGTANKYSGNVNKVARNDDMSSLKLPANCCVNLYEHYNFGGKVKRTCASTKWIGGEWNDKVSSLKVVAAPKITLRGDEEEVAPEVEYEEEVAPEVEDEEDVPEESGCRGRRDCDEQEVTPEVEDVEEVTPEVEDEEEVVPEVEDEEEGCRGRRDC